MAAPVPEGRGQRPPPQLARGAPQGAASPRPEQAGEPELLVEFGQLELEPVAPGREAGGEQEGGQQVQREQGGDHAPQSAAWPAFAHGRAGLD